MPSRVNVSRPKPVAVPTVAWALRFGGARLAARGIDAPEAEALRLWAALAGVSPGAVWLLRADTPSASLLRRFMRAVERRAAGEPAAYATGVAGFRTLDLAVDPRVLIPRPETEGLVEVVLRWCGALQDQQWGRALDVGTGSGCIALSLAVEGRFARVVATDASRAAAAVARDNVKRLQPPTAVEVRVGRYFEPVEGERFRVIVANPPYVTPAEYATLEDGVRAYEPRGALVSAAEGMHHLETILDGAAAHLVRGGLLALEVDCRRAERTAMLARERGWMAEVRSDLFGRQRYLLATRE